MRKLQRVNWEIQQLTPSKSAEIKLLQSNLRNKELQLEEALKEIDSLKNERRG